METRKRVLGAEHPSTLTSTNNLVSTYMNQGRWKEVEELFVRRRWARSIFLEIFRLQLPRFFPSPLIAVRRRQVGMLVSEIRSRVLGLEHPGTLNSMNAGRFFFRFGDISICNVSNSEQKLALETARDIFLSSFT